MLARDLKMNNKTNYINKNKCNWLQVAVWPCPHALAVLTTSEEANTLLEA